METIYTGTFGAVHWTVAGLNEFPTGSTNPGWSYRGEVTFGQFRGPDYAVIDDPTMPGADINGGIAAVGFPGSFTFEMTGLSSTYLDMTVRIGIMADILGPGEWALDTNKSYQLVQTIGGTGDSGVVVLRSNAAANGQPEIYFFDVTGVNPGDTFAITAFGSLGNAFPGYIGPVTWDVFPTPVPEPSALILCSLAGGAWLVRRRR